MERCTDIVTLRVPRDPGSVGIVRVILDGVALRRDLPIDALDDLKLAVETIIAEETPDGEPLVLEFAAIPGALSVLVDGLTNQSLREALLAKRLSQPKRPCFLEMKVVLDSLVDDYRIIDGASGCFGVQMEKRVL